MGSDSRKEKRVLVELDRAIRDFYTGEIGIIDSVRTSQIEDITLEIKELGKMMDKFKEDKTEKESNKELEQDDESRSDDDEPIQ